MTAVARMAMLNVRTVAPYRTQTFLVFALGCLVFATRPTILVPALVFLFTSQLAPYPFNVADKADLDTLYAVLPLRRRSVLYGHYAWAVALFAATAFAATVLATLFARAQAVSFGGHTLIVVLTLAWALFAINVAIQFPLLIGFGYTRVVVLGTALPLAIVVRGVYMLHVSLPSTQVWLPLLWIAGVVALMVSVVVAVAVDKAHLRRSVRRPRGTTAQNLL